LKMKKQALTAIEIEALVLSSSTGPDERRQPVSDDGGYYPSKPETRTRAALRWLIDSLAIAGAGMAGVYVGYWLDPSNVSAESRAGEDDLNDSFGGERASANEQAPAQIASGTPERRSAISTITPSVPFGADENMGEIVAGGGENELLHRAVAHRVGARGAGRGASLMTGRRTRLHTVD
jgi:hypothetical protein